MDKDIIEVIAEMLIKQDETTAGIKETNERIKGTAEKINETNEILREFMAVSVKRWDQQQRFNEKFFEKLGNIEKWMEKMSLLEDRVKHLESLEDRLLRIEKLLKAS
ncbi:ABC-type Fe3+-citrate transport system substrate-binding protein [Pedobacter sp. UYP30]|uniref:hypothetical protein n=1 Tax=Pedobacter sp. UYP30 TaxID=1756400 RepID=UPI003390C21C